MVQNPIDPMEIDRRLIDDNILRNEVLIGINKSLQVQEDFLNYFRFSINNLPVRCINQVKPSVKFNVIDSANLISSVSNSFIKLSASDNTEIMCLLAFENKKGSFANSSSLYYFMKDNKSGNWNIFQIFLKFNLVELILSNFNSIKIEVNYLYPSFSLSTRLNESISWAKSMLKTVLGFYLEIALENTNKYMTDPAIFSSFDRLEKEFEPSQDISQQNSTLVDDIKPNRLIQNDNLQNELSIKMRNMEDSLLEIGAIPGKDYTYLDLLKMVNDKNISSK